MIQKEYCTTDHSYDRNSYQNYHSSKSQSHQKQLEISNKVLDNFLNRKINNHLSLTDYALLESVLKTRSADAIAQVCLQIPSIRHSFVKGLSEEIGQQPEFMKNRCHAFVSVLMKKEYNDLINMDFTEIINEMCDLFPDLFDIILLVILPKSKRACTSAVASMAPKISIIYAIPMQSRISELSRFQRVLSMCLMDSICDQKV